MTIAGNFNGETFQEAGSLQSLSNLSKKKKTKTFSLFAVCDLLNDKAVFVVTLTLTFSNFLFQYSQLQFINENASKLPHASEPTESSHQSVF